MRGATWNRHDMEGDWREGRIVTVGKQLTLCMCMHKHTRTKEMTENCMLGSLSACCTVAGLSDLT